jgi:PAS domain S-box-containing protein
MSTPSMEDEDGPPLGSLLLLDLLDSLPDGLVVVSREGNIVLVNAQTEAMFGYRQEEMLGRPVEMLLAEPHRSGHREHRQRYFEAPQIRAMGSGLELSGRKKDGGEVPVSISLNMMRSGTDEHAIAIIRDITDQKQIETSLHAAEEQFRTIIEGVQDYAILMLTADGRVATWNSGAERIKGYTSDEIIGKHISVFYPPEEVEAGKPDRELHVAATGRFEEEGWRLRKDGSVFWANVVITPLMKESDRVAGFVKVIRDISERKKAQEALLQANAELERFFSVSIDMLCISHADGYFKRISPAFTQSLGWTEEEMLSRPFVDFIHPEDLDISVAMVEAQVVRNEPILSFENRYLHKDRSWRVLSWKSVPQEGGYMYAVARDVTEQRHIASMLQEAKQEAVTANLAKSEFLSRMSHELRTPMNSVLGYAQLLDLQNEDAKVTHAARSILKSGRHLLTLINEILDLSRIESGRFSVSIEVVPIAPVVQQAIAVALPIASGANVRLDVDGDMSGDQHVLADRQRLLQVLINILSNAIKYNRHGGQVRVRWTDVDGERIRFEVADTGHGIAPKDQEHLFEPFQRFGDPTIEGTGLGLALSERFVKIMGGRIGLLQSGPLGSVFYVELKKADATRQESSLGAIEKSRERYLTGKRGTVLYIEDNAANLSLLESVLSDWKGLTLIPASEGFGGLELARKLQPDLILLDLHLPDIMGDQVLARLKADPTTRSIPVAILSADVTPHQIQALLSAGAVDYLTKPLDLLQLFHLLQIHLPNVVEV